MQSLDVSLYATGFNLTTFDNDTNEKSSPQEESEGDPEGDASSSDGTEDFLSDDSYYDETENFEVAELQSTTIQQQNLKEVLTAPPESGRSKVLGQQMVKQRLTVEAMKLQQIFDVDHVLRNLSYIRSDKQL